MRNYERQHNSKVKEQRKSILVLVQYFGQGGAEKVAAMVASMLAQNEQYQVCYCALYASKELPRIPGVSVRSLGLEPRSGIAGKLLNYRKGLQALRQLKRELKVALTISSLWPVDWMNALTGAERKIAVIQINILNNPQNTAMVRAKRLVTAIYRKMDRIVLGGSNLQEELTQFFGLDPQQLQVIYNPIDTQLIDRNIQEPLTPPLEQLFGNGPVFVAANRLAEIKNTIALVRIWKLLGEETRPKLLIIGEGEEKDAIIQAANAYQLSWTDLDSGAIDPNARIYFLKFQRNIHNIIARSTGFLFPTKGEGLPLGLLEAMYAGVPVIVSDCPNGGIGEIMQASARFDAQVPRTQIETTEGGYLMPIPLTDASDAQWAATIDEVLEKDAHTLQAIRAANRRRAGEFDVHQIGRAWNSLTEEVIAK